MSEVRNNPPAMVNTTELIALYQTLYDDITRDGKILEFADRNLLGLLAVNIAEMEVYRAHVVEHGVMMTVKGDRGMVTKGNKNADFLDKKENRVIAMFKAFGMAPEYRTTKAALNPTQPMDDGFGKV